MSFRIRRQAKQNEAIQSVPTQRNAEPTYEEHLASVVDNFSPVGPRDRNLYLDTLTYRGPARVYLFQDEGTPHAKNYVQQRDNVTTMYRIQTGVADGARVAGFMKHVITERDGEGTALESTFHARRDNNDFSVTLAEGECMKEFYETYRQRTGEAREEIAWLERESGMLDPDQLREMAIVGFALSVVGPHPDAIKSRNAAFMSAMGTDVRD